MFFLVFANCLAGCFYLRLLLAMPYRGRFEAVIYIDAKREGLVMIRPFLFHDAINWRNAIDALRKFLQIGF